MAPWDLPDPWVVSAHLEPPEYQGHRVLMEPQAQRGPWGRLAPLDLLDLEEPTVCRD